MIRVLRQLRRRLQGPGLQSRQFHRCHSTTHGICVPSLEWRTNSKTTRFILQETWGSPASTTDSIRLSLSGSALQDEIKSCTAVLMHTSSPASFSNYGIFIPKVRAPSSSHKKIINIVELCPTVNSPLERTSEGNPRVQYVDQVQNPTKNPFTYLMSTVAFFKLQMICFIVFFYLILKFTVKPVLATTWQKRPPEN